MTFPLGWSIVTQTVVRRERWPGNARAHAVPLVYPDQDVLPDQPVMRLESDECPEELPGLPRLSLPSSSPNHSPLAARSEGGSLPQNTHNPSGQVVLPAGLRGRVVAISGRGGVVIESRATVIQGAIGTGGQVAGVLTLWQATSASQAQQTIPPGAILVIPGPLNFAMLRYSLSSGVVGVIASSASARDIEGFLRTDLVNLIDSANIELAQAHLPPLTMMLTEGFGTLAMPARTMNIFSKYQGTIALLSGATSVRQQVFPELVISLPLEEAWNPTQPDPTLSLGAQVRLCCGAFEGMPGEITYLFTHRQLFPSGLRARAARIRLEDSSMVVVPLSGLERIG